MGWPGLSVSCLAHRAQRLVDSPGELLPLAVEEARRALQDAGIAVAAASQLPASHSVSRLLLHLPGHSQKKTQV